MSQAKSAEKVVQEIRRKTRRQFSAEEKIRIVLEGLRGEESIAALCRHEGRRPAILARRELIKRRTLVQRKRENLQTPHGAVNRPRVSLAKPAHWSPLV